MGAKVDFITPDKLIQPTIAPDSDGVISIDFHVDIFSDGKEDWLVTSDGLSKLKFPMAVEGGVDVATGTLGRTFILSEGWHITPYAADHSFTITGNVYTGDGTPLVIFNTDYAVAVEYVTTLTPPGLGLTPEQADALEQSVFNNYITIDAIVGTSNTAFPAGTTGQPINNIDDGKTVAAARDIDAFFLKTDLTLASDDDVSGYLFNAPSPESVTLTVTAGALTSDTRFRDIALTGTLSGGNLHFDNCDITSDGLAGVLGDLHYCKIAGDITTAGETHLIDCYSGIAGTDHATIDVNGGDANITVRGYNGGIGVANSTNANFRSSFDLVSGQIFVDSDMLAGSVTCRGVGQLTNVASSDVNVNSTYLVDDTTKMNVIGKEVLDSNGVLTLYKDDGVTVLSQQTITDKDGNTITLDAGTPAQRTANG